MSVAIFSSKPSIATRLKLRTVQHFNNYAIVFSIY